MDEWMDDIKLINGWMDGWMHEWMDGWMDAWINELIILIGK